MEGITQDGTYTPNQTRKPSPSRTARSWRPVTCKATATLSCLNSNSKNRQGRRLGIHEQRRLPIDENPRLVSQGRTRTWVSLARPNCGAWLRRTARGRLSGHPFSHPSLPQPQLPHRARVLAGVELSGWAKPCLTRANGAVMVAVRILPLCSTSSGFADTRFVSVGVSREWR
jgi:hypothetical protein